MATYTPVPRHVPSEQRASSITLVAVGDQIDIVKVLGRPARRVQFVMTDAADVIQYRLNNLTRIRKVRKSSDALTVTEQAYGAFGMDDAEHDFWSQSDAFPQYSSTGAVIIETAEGLEVESIEIEAMTLTTGSVIQIVVW